MPKFSYRARDKSGKETKGFKDANDRYELARFLRTDGLLLLSAEDVSLGDAKKGFNFSLTLPRWLMRVKLTEKIIFSKNLGIMIGAGLPLTRALDALARESHNPKFQAAINGIVDQVRQGKTFSESLASQGDIFSQLYISMVEAGEKSGKLQESLAVLANQMQADSDLIRKVRGAMIYPGVILAAMILIGILMLIYVVPTLSSVFKELNVELPATTKLIIFVSDAFLDYLLYIVGGFIIALALAIRLAHTTTGKHFIDRAFIRFPLIGPLAKQFNSARTARTLSSLISAGVQVLEALDITSRVIQNHLYSAILQEARVAVQKGETMSKVFLKYENLYPSLMGEMLAVGEETGEMSKMLREVAGFYETQVADATRDLSTIIEPLMMIIIGAAVGFFAISMIQPMYSLTDTL